MKHFKLLDTVCGWVVFAIAAATYLLTMEPTASFWDCGEFIASASKLDVGHPPGAPFFMLMGRFFTMLAPDQAHMAMYANALSALASAFTILFLFWTITALARQLVKEITTTNGIAILAAGVVGALAYTWSDTFWFSAVEGEVYGSSSFFTAVVFWLILKWYENADKEGSDKWLVLIAYLMGLSIGVHLLNLLTIPAIVLVYYFRRFEFSWKGFILSFLASVGILAGILFGIIPGIPTIAGWFELLFTNTFGLPFNTGLAIYLILLFGCLAWGIYETYKNQNITRRNVSFILGISLAGVPFLKESAIVGIILILLLTAILFYYKEKVPTSLLNTIMSIVTVIVIGYSSYAVVVIRSNADPPMDQNSPDNVFALKYYLNREQYGDTPLLYGPVYNAPVALDIRGNRCIPVMDEGAAQYAPKVKTHEGEKDEYVVTGHKTSYKFRSEFMMFFPRLHSQQGSHIEGYKRWADIKGKRIRYDYCGEKRAEYCPTFGENLRFFFRYQVNFMYWRYFMWNFSGRQNNIQGHGEIHHGNWITGISFIDKSMLGDQDKLPTVLKENKGRNVFYMLPLILGLIGIVWQCNKKLGDKQVGWHSFAITFLLFFLTGLAIVLYLNQTPYQPRERDYAYAGSFYAFCIWIGLGVMALIDGATNLMKNDKFKPVVAGVIALIGLGVPLQMVSQTWDDHDRSGRYSCRDFGSNYLNSCEKNGILFTYGDNDTFPLWYCQEVEGIRTDVRDCNLSYLQTDWYIGQMKRPYYESEGLPISWQPKDYMPGTNEWVYARNKIKTPLSVDKAFQFLLSDDPRTKMEGMSYIPTNQLFVYAPDSTPMMLRSSERYTRSEMMTMDIISGSNWERPIYFSVSGSTSIFLGLEPYFEITGLTYHLTPVRSADGRPRINTEVMYDNMMNNFKYGNMSQPDLYIDETLLNMCYTHRSMFIRLAEALLRENKKDSAIKVLDYCEEVLPKYNIPYESSSASMGGLYYAMGETQKANAIMDELANMSVEFLRWGTSLKKKERESLTGEMREYASLLSFCMGQFQRYQQTELFDRYESSYRQYVAQ